MIVELTKNIKVIRPEAKSAFPYSNSLYIDDDIQTMIDAGAGKAYKEIAAENIDLVLISHNHFDHINGLPYFTKARIFAGREETLTYTDPQVYLEFSGFSRWEELMGQKKVGNMNALYQMPDDVPSQIGFQPISLTGVFKDGDEFNLGRTMVKTIHTPGHTPGHYSFYIEKEGILFSGDIDMSPRGPWYGNEYSDLDELIDSVQRIKDIKPRILVTSHRRIFYHDINQRLDEFINTVMDKEEQILEYLIEPRTLDDIAAQDFAYENELRNRYIVFWAKIMIEKHLKRLARLNKIEKIGLDKYIKI
ncbi:MAG TPA: MBL fold metallo-hydrolase [Syntrophomonadaceae bacterium]|nr:MBL fold metallo-hydrolase [Syntrophomonadaceae bacterium]